MNLSQFKELFNPLPGNCYLHVTSKVDEIMQTLQGLLENVNGELHVALYSDDAEMLEKIDVAKKQQIEGLKKPFRALPRDHDMVVFQNILSKHQHPKQLLKTAYTTLANAAHIIILEPKGKMDTEALMSLLDELEYRTPNQIDILEEYDLIMAKKLHMWGNGL